MDDITAITVLSMLEPCNPEKEDFVRVAEYLDFGRLQIMNILKELTIEDIIIVGWC